MSSSTSQVPATSFSSSFQLIFNTALKDYEKKTKRDLLANPLVSRLQACDSPASIIAVLQSQVEDMDKAQKCDERLTKWLSPTVNVLLTFSATIGGGVSLVRIKYSRCRTTNLTVTMQVFSPASVIFAGAGVLLQVSIISTSLREPILTSELVRRSRMSMQHKTP